MVYLLKEEDGVSEWQFESVYLQVPFDMSCDHYV